MPDNAERTLNGRFAGGNRIGAETRFAFGNTVARDNSSRTKALLAYCKKLQEEFGLPVAVPADVLAYVIAHGRDPLEAHQAVEIEKFIREKGPIVGFRAVGGSRTGREGKIHFSRWVDLETLIQCAKALLPYRLPRVKALDYREIDRLEDEERAEAERRTTKDPISEDPDVRSAMEQLGEVMAREKQARDSEGKQQEDRERKP